MAKIKPAAQPNKDKVSAVKESMMSYVMGEEDKTKGEIIPKWVQEASVITDKSEPISNTENVVKISEDATSPEKLAIKDAVVHLTGWFENGTTRGQIMELRDKLKALV